MDAYGPLLPIDKLSPFSDWMSENLEVVTHLADNVLLLFFQPV